MSRVRTPSPESVMHYGKAIATVKANMPPRKWRRFVKAAHAQGHTVEGQLSGVPEPLMERTPSSLRKQAMKTLATSYKPVYKSLDTRTAAANFLDQKRADDDAAYRTWLTGEVGKLDAQARAADATLATQQTGIQTDLANAQQAAHADSIKRMTDQPGNVSDPSQSTALDTTAADARSAGMVANARQQTHDLTAIGDDAQTISNAAILATAAVREATRQGDTWKTLADINTDRMDAKIAQAKDTEGLLTNLQGQQQTNAENTRQFQLAQGELGVKEASVAAQVKAATQRYNLDHAKFNLSKWTAHHADAVAQGKLQLGYDQIKAQKGKAAADRALRKWEEKYRERHADARNNADNAAGGGRGGKNGASATELKHSDDQYGAVETARSFIYNQVTHKHRTLPEAMARAASVGGFSAPVIALAVELRQNDGHLTPVGIQRAKNIGIINPRSYWQPAPHGTRPSEAGNPNVGG